jgi:sterol desaturase/sphingolipid hydroxylase (fatty acid hydroxylase superfamily)
MMMVISIFSISSFFIIFFGYIIQSSLLIFFYYYLNDHNKQEWKIQKDKGNMNKAPYHRIITTFNLIMASSFSLITTELTLKNRTNIKFTNLNEYGIYYIIQDMFIAVLYQSIIEYYWHRMMHLKWFYATFHKLHHAYKAPEIWDDMYIHPLEAFGYYCILYAPPYLFQCQCNHMHILSFVLYMVIMGICGVLDHSGVSLALILPFYLPVMSNRNQKQNKKSWWISSLSSSTTTTTTTLTIYDTKDHDLHHKLFNVNYSFPFPFMDMLHGTYYSESNS